MPEARQVFCQGARGAHGVITAKPGTVQGNYLEFISKTRVKIVRKRESCSVTAAKDCRFEKTTTQKKNSAFHTTPLCGNERLSPLGKTL